MFFIACLSLLAMPSGCRWVMPIEDGPADCHPNGVREPGEACDGEDFGGLTCESLGYHAGRLACTSTCRLDNRDCLSSGFCGDGVMQAPFEECDEDDLDGQSCESLHYYGGVLTCGPDCRLNRTGCIARCDNDGMLDPGEECDGADLNGQTCESLGYHGGILVCGPDCRPDISDCERAGRCGDGLVQPEWETCEPGNANVLTCEDLGYHPGTLACRNDCFFDVSGCGGRCGDAHRDAGFEECDGTDLGGQTCESLGYYSGWLLCNSDCVLNRTGCTGYCGDGVVQTQFENCDPLDPDRPSCRSLLHFTGEYCSPASCQLDESGCENATSVDSLGNTTCARLTGYSARCWGGNNSGQVGDGTTTQYLTPVRPQIAGNVRAACSGTLHSCALLEDGTLQCWGDNQYGQLGLGHTVSPQLLPVPVPGLSDVTALDCGGNFTCAIHSGGLLSCWGNNTYGQLGIGNHTNQNVPTPVPLPTAVHAISTGSVHACAVLVDQTLYCWGNNDYGQLGDGSTINRSSPTLLPDILGAYAIAAGGEHSCAAVLPDHIYCWGRNNAGQLGTGSTFPLQSALPMNVDWNAPVLSMASGYSHVCAVDGAHNLWCWGLNASGQLGIGNTGNQRRPTRLSNIYNVESVTAGTSHTCAVQAGGLVYCWGNNASGQLGDGTTTQRLYPVAVAP